MGGYARNSRYPLPFFHKYLLSLSKHSYKPYSGGDRHLEGKLINIVMKYNEGDFRVPGEYILGRFSLVWGAREGFP